MYFGGEDNPGAGTAPPYDAIVSASFNLDSLATAESYPIIYFNRTGGDGAVIILVLNESSRKEMRLTYEMSDGEEVEIDFKPGRRTVTSSLYAVAIDVAEALRNRLGEVVPGSDFATWSLVPGENNVSIYVQPIGPVTIDVSMRWQPLHWSADAGEV